MHFYTSVPVNAPFHGTVYAASGAFLLYLQINSHIACNSFSCMTIYEFFLHLCFFRSVMMEQQFEENLSEQKQVGLLTDI